MLAEPEENCVRHMQATTQAPQHHDGTRAPEHQSCCMHLPWKSRVILRYVNGASMYTNTHFVFVSYMQAHNRDSLGGLGDMTN